MDFSRNNCKAFDGLYTYILSKKYGIGNGELKFKDLLLSYLNINWIYLPNLTSDENTVFNSIFVGQLVSTTTILPVPTNATKYYINDQAAFDDGVPKDAVYFLAQNNTYGSPFGTPKKLVEDVN